MPLFQWTETYSVSVSAFDNQHKVLVDLINKLFDAMKEGRGKDVLSKIFDDLIDYTVIHFQTEEKLFKENHYPDETAHKNAHEALTTKALALRDKFKSGDNLISIDVLNFLKDWLTNHILDMDKKYSKFFNDKGIK